MPRRLTFKCKIERKKKVMFVMSLEYTPVTQNVLCLMFLLYVRNVQRLNYGGQESGKTNLHFVILIH